MAEVRSVSSTGGEKGVKVQAYDKIPPSALIELAKLYGVGALKYADHNFRRGYEWRKSYASLQRHANLFWSGEDIDLEMNVSHMASVAWHGFALTEFFFTFQKFDDRPVAPIHVEHDFEVGVIESKDYPAKHQDTVVRAVGEVEPRFDLLPQRPLAELARFYGEDAAEPVTDYGRAWSDEYARLQEHSVRFWAGENYFPATGHLNSVHITHHAFNLIELSQRFVDYDDRLIEGAAPIGFTSLPNK
jgi:hypothetical protein